MAAAAPLAVALGPVLSQLMAPKPNAFTGTSAPQHISDQYMQLLTNEFGREQGQAAQGVSLPDAVVQQSPTMTGGVLPFPIGVANKGLGSGGITGLGGFGGNRGGDSGPILDFPGGPDHAPSTPGRVGPLDTGGLPPDGSNPDLPGDNTGGSPGGNEGNPGGHDMNLMTRYAPDVRRVQTAAAGPRGSANSAADAQSALRLLGMKLGR